MKNQSLVFFLLFTISSFGQYQLKIDSIFNHYFKALDLELSKKIEIKKNVTYYDEIILDNGEKVYTNKYGGEAIIFLQKITEIKAPTKHTGIYMSPYVTKDILKKWKSWYKQNRNTINWY